MFNALSNSRLVIDEIVFASAFYLDDLVATFFANVLIPFAS
jgi:hypothetical protein